jgi:hypothetical protein
MSNNKMSNDGKPNLIGELARIFGSCAGSALLHSLSGGRVTLLPASNPAVPPQLPAPVLASLSPAPSADPSPEPVDSPKPDVEATEEVMPLAKQPAKRRRPGEPSGPWEYQWVRSCERADFVGQGLLTYRGEPYIALEILLQDIVIARAALAPTANFSAFHTLGMRLSTNGELPPLCERVKFDYSEETWGFRVEAGPLEKLAPKIDSLQKALCLHKGGKALLLPKFPGLCAPEKRFSFDREDNSYSAVPFVVRIERRRTTEPIVHVQWFLISPCGEDDFEHLYGGTSLMSWRDAVTIGKYGTLYAKVSLPERDGFAWFPPGSWCPVRVEGVSTRRGKNEFAEALVLDREGIPKEIQEFIGRYRDIQTAPLNMDRLCAHYRKSWGFALRDE